MLNSIVGLLDSGASAGGGGSFESISTVTVGAGGSASVSLSSIPSTYKHLQVRILAKTDGNDTASETYMQINSTNMEYTHQLIGNGSAASATSGTVSAIGDTIASGTGYSSMFSVYVIDILDYADTNKIKVIRLLNGGDRNGGGVVKLVSGLRTSTTTISSLTFTAQSARNFVQYSHFALYGIKGA